MDFITLMLTAIGLSMDAFAVSICKGLSMPKIEFKKMLIVGLWFGIFQALMPTLGYFLGITFADFVTKIAPYVAFVLLFLIGANMIKESLEKEKKELNDSLGFKVMFVLAIATSIDAFAVGVSFALLDVEIIPAVSLIGVTTLLLSMVGVKIGNVFGLKYKAKAEFIGGIILIAIGLKILLEGILK